MEDCVFCKIISGEIPSYGLYEDSYCKVILDRFPGSAGHILVIAKEHKETVFALEEAVAAKLFQTAARAAKVLQQAFGVQQLNIVQNNGAAAGQTVPHFHIHVIPREEGDTIQVQWPQLDLSEKAMEEMQKRLQFQ